MKNIFDKFWVLGVSFLLISCGTDDSLQIFDDEVVIDHSESFTIGNQEWTITPPDNWKKLTSFYRGNDQVIFAMEQMDQKFLIQQNYETAQDIPKNIFEKAADNLFFFFPVEFKADLWKFRGKTAPHTPLREFWQKVYKINNGPYFLLGTCSFEYQTEKEHDCEKIFANWKMFTISTESTEKVEE